MMREWLPGIKPDGVKLDANFRKLIINLQFVFSYIFVLLKIILNLYLLIHELRVPTVYR